MVSARPISFPLLTGKRKHGGRRQQRRRHSQRKLVGVSPELSYSLPFPNPRARGERRARGFYFGDSGHGKQRLAMAAAAAMAMASRSSWGALLGQRDGLPRVGDGLPRVGAGRGRCGGAHLERNRTKIAWARRSTGRSVLGEKQRWWKLERGGRRAAWLGGSATLGWRWRAVWGAFYRRRGRARRVVPSIPTTVAAAARRQHEQRQACS